MGILDTIFETVKTVAPTVAAMGANALLPGVGGPLVHRLMRQVTGDSPDTPIDEVAQKFEANPEHLVQLKQIAANKEIQLAQIAADENTQALAIYKSKPEYLKILPDLIFNLSMLFGVPGAILGVASWHRGVMQRQQAGDNKPGLVAGVIGAIKGKP